MIWLKENCNFVGYVPILEKKYTQEQIRKMSKFNLYEGWSILSKFVMNIQGINYEYHNTRCHYIESASKRLIDIRFEFDFEYFPPKNDPWSYMPKYIKQISEVFENLTLYKVEQYSEEKFNETILTIRPTIEQIISDKTLSSFDYDIKSFNDSAVNSFTNLQNLLKRFSDNGYTLSNNLFKDANKTIIKKSYKERKKIEVFVWNTRG